MPIIKSATKRMKQNAKRRERRKPYKTQMKTMIKKIGILAKEGKKKELSEMLPLAYKAIDMAAKKQIIHQNTAARKKSRVARLTYAASRH